MDMHKALDALLAVDQARQNAGRNPETAVEKVASDVIGYLGCVMRGSYPELAEEGSADAPDLGDMPRNRMA